ncbi:MULTISPECIES: hypothetical protein [Methylorubrum]|uniref:Uncharacterized protein n=1 Tax=Methylorubrum suomiense TaxID=144191 RepID=A0ABQ4UNG0_9HYPH|nr:MULTISPECIES: hypothetical protein [Methylobacteriaceae]GJE73863.1 hypothetical protein BGCPKDLD_0430 [Methylorubrum suomiense]
MRATTQKFPERTRLGSFFAGLSALVSVWPASDPARYPHRDEADALLSDGLRIGNDMRVVIEREHIRAQAEAE